MLLTAAHARAVVLKWGNEGWTPPGSLSNTYDVTPSNPGNDIRVTVSGDTGSLTIDPASGNLTPAVTNSLTGGSNKPSLELVTILGDTQSITITISFAQIPAGVDDVSFTLFDIDSGARNEILTNISATGVDGSTIYPTFSNGSAVTQTGSGGTLTFTGNSSSPDTGGGSGNGNVSLTFDPTTQVRSVSFTFTTSSGPPSLQQFSVSDIQFTIVPEVNPAWCAVISCLAAGGLILRHRAGLRK